MANRTIHLKGEVTRDEAKASGSITPGMLVERVTAATGATAVVKALSVADIYPGPILVAVEDELEGSEISSEYAANQRVQFNSYKKGDQFVGRIANGTNAAFGDLLVSDGAGRLKKLSADSSAVIAEDIGIVRAIAAKDMSDSSAADPATDDCAVEVV